MSTQFCCYSPNGTTPEKLTTCECPYFGRRGFKQLFSDTSGTTWCELHVPLTAVLVNGVAEPRSFAMLAHEIVTFARAHGAGVIDLTNTKWRHPVNLNDLARFTGQYRFERLVLSGAEFASDLSGQPALLSANADLAGVQVGGEMSITELGDSFDASGILIAGSCKISGPIRQGLQFSNAKIGGTFHVNVVRCDGDIDISGAKVDGDLRVDGSAHFNGRILATEARIGGNLLIEVSSDAQAQSFFLQGIQVGKALTIRTRRLQMLDVSHAHCGSLKLRGSIYEMAKLDTLQASGEIDTSQAQFHCYADFSSARILGKANLNGTQFFLGLSFRDSVFEGPVDFTAAEIQGRADFSGAVFKQSADFIAGSSDKQRTFPEIDFTQSIFSSAASFTDRKITATTRFNGTRFDRAPDFHGCVFHQDTAFRGTEFRDTSSSGASAAYRTLKLAMESARAKNEEAMFYALEQRSLRHQMKDSPFVKVLSWLYDWGSDYGQSVGWPLLWFGVIAGLAGFRYWGSLYWEATNMASFCLKEGDPSLSKIEIAIRHMFTQIVRPFEALTLRSGSGESRCVIPWELATLSTVQTIFHLGTIALLFLAIRRRFKMD